MIFAATITAHQTDFFFAGANASKRRTQLKYEGGEEKVAIWYRVNFYRWYRYAVEKFIEAKQDPSLAYRGQLDSEYLEAGDVVEYRIFTDLQHDPNNGNLSASGTPVIYNEAILMGFLEKPIKTRWYHEYKGAPGGTYYHASVYTPGVATHMLIQISDQEPVAGDFGTLKFPDVAAWERGFNAQGYEFDVVPRIPGEPAYPRETGADQRFSLKPGHNYYCLIRYSNASGDWWYEVEKFTTRQRVVTLKGDAIQIDNDGDPHARGEASFEILFRHANVGSVAFFMGGKDFKIDTGETITLGNLRALDTAAPIQDQMWPYPKKPVEKVFGPFAVTEEIDDISIELNGTEYDGFLEPDEPASTWVQPAYIYYPVGPAEAVTDQPASVTASPLIDGDDFQFTLKYRYSIAYV